MTDTPPLCSDEYEALRLQALANYQILDTPEESAFDEIVELASMICDAPVARISFVDRDRQWFKSRKGPGAPEAPRGVSVCAHALEQSEGVFIVPDTTQDPRFADFPQLPGGYPLRFYAGAVLESPDGYPLGTLCVRDFKPRELTDSQYFALKALAKQVMAQLELMRTLRAQDDLIRELEKRATTDPLTGLLNRRAFEQRFNQELALIQRGAPPAALIMIDLDYFKKVNDTLGHQVGDEVLVRFTELCRAVFREADVISRWGGDEFMVLLPRSAVAEAEHAAQRLHERLATTPMLDDISPPLIITASISISSLAAASNLDESFCKGDEMLYLAKKKGRNRTVSEAVMTKGARA